VLLVGGFGALSPAGLVLADAAGAGGGVAGAGLGWLTIGLQKLISSSYFYLMSSMRKGGFASCLAFFNVFSAEICQFYNSPT